MKKMIKPVLLMGLLVVGNAHAAFVGDFDLANWNQSINAGTIDLSGAPNSVVMVSSDDRDPNNKLTYLEQNQDLTIVVNQAQTINFRWNFLTSDIDGPAYDRFGYLLNGLFYQLSRDNGNNAQSGVLWLVLAAGDEFGFRANSFDSVFGSATTSITQFNEVNYVPIPAALSLIILPLLGMISRKRKLAA